MEFFVLVNFEDHIQIVVTPVHASDNGFSRALDKLVKLNKTFEKIGFATDAYLGFLTVSPENLGTGLQIEATIKLPNTKDETKTFETKLQESLHESKSVSVSITSDHEGSQTVHLQTMRTLAPNYNEMI
jgi:protein-arginine kinase